MSTEILFKDESYQIMGACFEVYKEMGSGFLEAVYQECLAKEFKTRGIPFTQKQRIKLSYKGNVLEQYYEADFVCYDKIIVEIKAHKALADGHRSQTLPKVNRYAARLARQFRTPPKTRTRTLRQRILIPTTADTN